MKQFSIGIFIFGITALAGVLLFPFQEPLTAVTGKPENPSEKLVPIEGGIYHAMSPSVFTGWNNDRDATKVTELEEAVGENIAWVSVSNTWFPSGVKNECLNGERNFFDKGIHFPRRGVEAVVRAGYTPSIRMLPYDRCIDPDYDGYKLQRFIEGEYDEELREWAREARSIPAPLLVTFGVEVNGDWFPWNMVHNGGYEKAEYGDPELYDGHERFRDAYRHIIDVFRDEGVENVTWFYHTNCVWPSEIGDPKSSMDAYYPGDDYIDWVAISCYGSQNAQNPYWWPMSETFDHSYQMLADSELIGGDKPIALMEYGVVEEERKPEWMSNFFGDVLSGKYPRLRAVGWWNSEFCLEYDSAAPGGCRVWSDVRVNSSEESLEVYRDFVSEEKVIGTPKFRTQ